MLHFKKGKNTILVPISWDYSQFGISWDYSQFGSYIMATANLIPVIFNLQSI